jgi:hypothetical protein
MSRANAVYAVMTLCLVAGMWAVLAYGAKLRAQPDLSGAWDLANDVSLAGLPPLGRTLRVEQSGQFLRFNFGEGHELDLTIAGRREVVRNGRATDVVLLHGDPWPKVEAEGDPMTDALRLRFVGPSDNAETDAVRTERTYPAPKKDAPR